MTTLQHQFHRLAEAIDTADGLLITAAAVMAVIIGYFILRFLRKRRERRREAEFDIPNFLRSEADASNNPGCSGEVDCLEVYWTRRKPSRGVPKNEIAKKWLQGLLPEQLRSERKTQSVKDAPCIAYIEQIQP